jgi:adenylate cyclase
LPEFLLKFNGINGMIAIFRYTMGIESYNLLYVDDELQNLISFKACFRKHYNVYTAGSAKEAIEILKQVPIHLVMTDQRMPEMTGVEFLENIIHDYPDTVRIILTGFSDMDAIIHAINTGRVFRYIRKPWDENELKMTIDNALHLYNLQQKNKELLQDLQVKVAEQEKILNVFQKFVPGEIVERVLKLQEDASLLEGEYRNVAVLFCDIRNFTALSEQISPKEVVRLLNGYYSMLSKVIKNHHGCVNQYVGDEIFAVFGAPAFYPDNEKNAVLCAMEMIEKLQELNVMYKNRIGREIEVGIGINSGEVVAGNLGSEDKIEYSITGDTVNTGKRIECLTKDNPNTILISESTFEKVKELVVTEQWAPVEVRGKSNKITVFEIKGKKIIH